MEDIGHAQLLRDRKLPKIAQSIADKEYITPERTIPDMNSDGFVRARLRNKRDDPKCKRSSAKTIRLGRQRLRKTVGDSE